MKNKTLRNIIWAIAAILAMILLSFGACANPALAEASTEATVPALDWTQIVTQIVNWVLGGVLTAIAGLATWAAKKYVYPWLRDVAVPWLKQNNLLKAAQVAVQYAEAVVGRYNGEEKLKLALMVLESRGYIYSDEVYQAVIAKWKELDIAQIAAGIKDTLSEDDAEPISEQESAAVDGTAE